MGQITATRNLVATKVVRHAGQWSVHLTCRGLCGMELTGAISAVQINSGIVIIPNMRQIMLCNRFFHYIPYTMWNELCRTFYPWCHGVSARCLCFSFFFLLFSLPRIALLDNSPYKEDRGLVYFHPDVLFFLATRASPAYPPAVVAPQWQAW